jgi:hypothetical protein
MLLGAINILPLEAITFTSLGKEQSKLLTSIIFCLINLTEQLVIR